MEFDQLVQQMITEQGDIWIATSERPRTELGNEVVITDRPDRCARLRLSENGEWQMVGDQLHIGESEEFFAEFGSSWTLLLNCWLRVSGEMRKVRAFIRNGRGNRGWTISIDLASVPLEKAA